MDSTHIDARMHAIEPDTRCLDVQRTERDALYRISDVIVNTGNLVELLNCALDVVLDITHLEIGAIYLYDHPLYEHPPKTFTLTAWRGLDEATLTQVGAHEPGLNGVGIVSQSAQCQSPVIIEHLADHPCVSHARAEIENAGLESLVCLPLLAEGEVVGALMILTRTPRQFSADDIALLKTVANQLAVGIRKASLFQEVAASEAALRLAYDKLQLAQRELVQRERLAVLGQLASSIGHELRNPLGVISTAAYFLTMTLPSPEKSVRDALNIIDREVARANKIITDLLDFAHSKPPHREKISMNDQIQAVLKRTVIPHNILLVTRLAHTLPPVMADGEQLQQIFHNLITNALQAMPDGGQLRIHTCLRGAKVECSISDTGKGIPKENEAKIFEPFFTTKAKGIGLGLAVSKSLVEANGGQIKLESQVNAGTTFTVILPAAPASAV